MDVFLFSMPRSGSTWLMELIWTQEQFKFCNEPLNIKGDFLRQQTKLTSFDELYIKGESTSAKLIDYFGNIRAGKHRYHNPNPLRNYHRWRTSRIVYKIIHGGEYFINDIADNCHGRVVYLLRHPIAVSLSRKVLPRLDVLCSEAVLSEFSAVQVKLAREIQQTGSYLQKGVLSWSIQNKLALNRRRADWIVLTYEQLTVEPQPIIEHLVKELGLAHPDRIYQQLSIPSAVKVQSEVETIAMMEDSTADRRKLIERWQSKVDQEEARRLFDIVECFELDVYDWADPYPKTSYLIKP